MNSTDLLGTVARLGLDVLSMLLLVGWLYRRRLAAPEMTLVFTALNIGLFAAVTSIGSGHFPTGIGFGLFGLLSLVRLRSAAFTLKDVAYTFVALVLALVNGLPDRDLLMVVLLDALLLVSLWVVDETRSRTPATRLMRVTLDTAVTDLDAALTEVRRRVSVEALSVVVEDVDLVRETTRVAVRYAVPEAPYAWPDAETADEEPSPRPPVFADVLPLDVSSRGTVSLAEVLVEAPMLTRVDRKYLVDVRTAQALVDRLPEAYRTLSIAGRTYTTYRSTYFDTEDLASCRAHVQQRRRRWKARSRLYVEDALCRVEVKARDGRGVTAKTVRDSHVDAYGLLDEAGAAFVGATLAAHAMHRRRAHPAAHDGGRLPPYDAGRHPRGDEPADPRLAGAVHARRRAGVARPRLRARRDQGRPAPRPRPTGVLSGLGARPRSFSKYVAAASLMRDDLPDNDVRALHGRELHLERASA